MGHWEKKVRQWSISDVKADASSSSVYVMFIEPKKRRSSSFTITSNNMKYLTIEDGGKVLYDTRRDVPCDMEKWAATNERFKNNRPYTIVRYNADGTEIKDQAA